MSRPRTATDAEILGGTARAISQMGPGRLTLADVGREVGLAPATLIQRFGSKRGLLLGLARAAGGTVAASFAAARAASPSPLVALVVAATEMARHVESPETLANDLASSQIDLSDPEFHRYALDQARATLSGYRTLLEDAIAVGELEPCDTARLARAIQAMSGGSLINWAIHRDGGVLDWVRADLNVVLAPYRRSPSSVVDPTLGVRRAGPRTRHDSPLAGVSGADSGPSASPLRPAGPRRRGVSGPP